MKIKVLGSGTILSGAERNPSGYLLYEENSSLLLDCGYGIVKQLINFNEDILKIDTVLISHLHLDHCSDLMAFLMRRHFIKPGSNKNLIISGCRQLKAWFQANAEFQGSWLKENLPSFFSKDNFIWQGWKVRIIPTKHTTDSLAFCFEKDQKKFFYSSDTGYNEELIDFAAGADVAIIECSHPDEQAVEHHLTPSQVALLAKKAKIKNLYITHIYPENDTADLAEQVKKDFPGNTQVLADGQIIKL